jgi:hypothetical protein
VAVGAEKLKVLYAVVGAVTIDVVKRHREWRAEPFRHAASLTPVLLETHQEQPALQFATIRVGTGGEELVQRAVSRPGGDEATPDRAVPGLSAEPEVARACPHTVSPVVELLHDLPVVSAREAFIGLPAYPLGMVGDGALRDIKLARDLYLAQTLAQKYFDSLACRSVQMRLAAAAPGLGGSDRRRLLSAPQVVVNR